MLKDIDLPGAADGDPEVEDDQRSEESDDLHDSGTAADLAGRQRRRRCLLRSRGGRPGVLDPIARRQPARQALQDDAAVAAAGGADSRRSSSAADKPASIGSSAGPSTRGRKEIPTRRSGSVRSWSTRPRPLPFRRAGRGLSEPGVPIPTRRGVQVCGGDARASRTDRAPPRHHVLGIRRRQLVLPGRHSSGTRIATTRMAQVRRRRGVDRCATSPASTMSSTFTRPTSSCSTSNGEKNDIGRVMDTDQRAVRAGTVRPGEVKVIMPLPEGSDCRPFRLPLPHPRARGRRHDGEYPDPTADSADGCGAPDRLLPKASAPGARSDAGGRNARARSRPPVRVSGTCWCDGSQPSGSESIAPRRCLCSTGPRK